MVTSICTALAAVIGLIVGIYKVFFSFETKQRKWREELYVLEQKLDELYLGGDEHEYNITLVKYQLLLNKGGSFGYKR
jgi:hypothetical protein